MPWAAGQCINCGTHCGTHSVPLGGSNVAIICCLQNKCAVRLTCMLMLVLMKGDAHKEGNYQGFEQQIMLDFRPNTFFGLTFKRRTLTGPSM